MKEADRQHRIRQRLVEPLPPPNAPLPTGFPELDKEIGGGLPRGAVVEIFGPDGCGKTALAIRIATHLQRSGGAAAWIDAEHTFDPALAGRQGLAIERLPVAQPDSAEQALEIARKLSASGAIDLIVVDSAAALVPEVELETAVGHSGHSLQNRVLSSGLRRLAADLRRNGTVLLFLNQTRHADDGETSAGGPALKLSAALRLALRASSDRRTIRFRVLKNKAGVPFREGTLTWENDSGLVETP